MLQTSLTALEVKIGLFHLTILNWVQNLHLKSQLTPQIIQQYNFDFMYNFDVLFSFFLAFFLPLTVTLCMKKLELGINIEELD